MYADDTQLYYNFISRYIEFAKQILNEDLSSSVLRHSKSHCLLVNPSPSIVMLLDLNVNQVAIQVQNSAGDLSLIFDIHMGFKQHITKCIQKS